MGTHNSVGWTSNALESQQQIDDKDLDLSQLQKHIIELHDQSEIKYQQQIFQFRKKHARRVVTAYLFHDLSSQCMCGQVDSVCYFTERLKSDFSRLVRIEAREGLALMVQCLEGLEILYGKFGGFEVSVCNIVFDQHNELKVWISQNLTQVKPAYATPQHLMLKQLFCIFDRLQPTPSFYSTQLARLQARKGNQVSFGEVKQHILAVQTQYLAKKTYLKLDSPVTSMTVLTKKCVSLALLRKAVVLSNCIGVQTQQDYTSPRFGYRGQSIGYPLKPLQANHAIRPITLQTVIQRDSISLTKTQPFTESTQRFSSKFQGGKQNINQMQHLYCRQAPQNKLSNLATMKSIVHYSDISLDSTIKADLQNYQYS